MTEAPGARGWGEGNGGLFELGSVVGVAGKLVLGERERVAGGGDALDMEGGGELEGDLVEGGGGRRCGG